MTDMVNECESLINFVTYMGLKVLLSPYQNGKQVVTDVCIIRKVVYTPVGGEAKPKSVSILEFVERGKPNKVPRLTQG